MTHNFTSNHLHQRPFPRRNFLRGSSFAGAGLATAALVGCGNDDDDDNGNGQTPADGETPQNGTTPEPAATDEAPAERPGGTWRRGAGGNIALTGLPYIDAGTLAGGGNAALRSEGLLFGTLVRIAEGSLDFEPDHADEWEWSSDRQSITFHLRDDIYWHSGRQFTADDVAFNLEEIKKERWATGHAARLNPLTGYEVIDPQTIRFDLIRPDAMVMEFASKFRLADMETIDQIENGVIVGTGAFKLERLEPIQGATLVANERYHFGQPLLDTIEYTIFDDPAALAIALETGEIDDSELSSEEAVRFYDDDRFETVLLPPSGGTTPIGFRTDMPPVDDPRVRQAIGFLLDRTRYQEDEFVGRFDELGRLYWSDFSPAYDAELDEPIYDPDRARDLLRDAGYPNGISEPIIINTLPIRPYSPAIAQLLQQEGREVGLNIEFAPLEYSDMLDRYYNANLDHMWLGFGDSGSPLSPAASLLFNTLTDGAVTRYDNPEYLEARQAILEGSDDYDRFNQAFIDGAFAHVISRQVYVNFESERIHYVRNGLGGAVWHKTWVSD